MGFLFQPKLPPREPYSTLMKQFLAVVLLFDHEEMHVASVCLQKGLDIYILELELISACTHL